MSDTEKRPRRPDLVLLHNIVGIQGDDPDIRNFGIVSTIALFMTILALLFTCFLWLNDQNVIFAIPEIPLMGDCSLVDGLDSDNITDSDRELPIVRAYTGLDGIVRVDRMVADCHYNLDLSGNYIEFDTTLDKVVNLPGQTITEADLTLLDTAGWLPDLELANISVEAAFKMVIIMIALLNVFILPFIPGETIYGKFGSIGWFSNVFLSLIMVVLAFAVVDITWFFIGRSLSQPLIYDNGTSILFVTLLAGVFSFIYLSWFIQIDLTNLSLFTSLILLCGLIISMLLTSQIWYTGATNAYSIMSEITLDEHLTYEVLNTQGSRGVFRITCISAGILVVVYIMKLSALLDVLEQKLQTYFDFDISEETPFLKSTSIRGKLVLGVGILAGVLIAFIGTFPTDGLLNPISQDMILSKSVSGGIHRIGAMGSPVVFIFMMLTFWFIAYPKNDKTNLFLAASSRVWVIIVGTAIMMYLMDSFLANFTTFLNADSARRSIMDFLPSAGYVLVFIAVLYWMIDYAQKLRTGETPSQNDTYSPVYHWLLIVIMGIIGAFVLPGVMNTVTVEFVILIVFSLFLFSFSTYLIELEQELDREIDIQHVIIELRKIETEE